MGLVYADIELFNWNDVQAVCKGNMGEEEIKRFPLNILVDSGSNMLAINENIFEALQLSVIRKERFSIANNEIGLYDVAAPIEIRFKNRTCLCSAVVLPGSSTPLLGAIPMEEMDLIIHPKNQELVTNPDHGEYGLWRL